MKFGKTIRRCRTQAGIALLISIFVLLLISVVAIALIVSSGTESALAGNYRASTGSYYAALAGLEEARERLLPKNANSFSKTAPGFIPSPLPVGSPVYIINPTGAEVIAPWDPASTYPDLEYNSEFNPDYSLPNPSPSQLSGWNTSPLNTLGVPVPLYKWVRINAISEKSLRDNFDGNPTDFTTPVYYDYTTGLLNTTSTGSQVFEITALGSLPNGSQKLLQYLAVSVPPVFRNFPSLLSFPAALTIAGDTTNGVAFSAPTSNGSYFVSGKDLTTVPFCTPGLPVHAVGVFDGPDVPNVITGGNGGSGIPSGMRSSYDGVTIPPPADVQDVMGMGLLPANLQKPSEIDFIAQTVTQNADVIYPPGPINYPLPTVNGGTLSSQTPAMSSANPMTVVINGNLDLNAWHHTGYGMLLVIGNLNYDPDASWQGIILVIGQGTVTGSKAGIGEFDGEVFVANTRDSSGNLYTDPNLGKASVIFSSNMGGTGIRYSSCWTKRAQPTGSLKILSFHEISQ